MPQLFADQFRSIAMSPDLSEALERAYGFAREQGHRAVTLEHLLLAFTEDVDASAVLQASNIDLIRLGTDVSGYLGRLLEDMRGENGAEPRTDPELLRVLHAAVQAAQQSRRRQIDGAIVLAAVVGDGKSPAAGLLKAHGLTFEEVIRALQKANAKANAQARSKQFATPAPTPAPTATAPVTNGAQNPSSPSVVLEPADTQGSMQSVDEILAAARNRIQQRTAAIVGKAVAGPAEPPAPPADPESPHVAAQERAKVATASPSAEPDAGTEEAQTPSALPPPTQQAPAQPPSASRAGPGWTPPTAGPPGPPSPRLPQPHAQRPAGPLPQRASQGDGPPRPPLPHRSGPPTQGLPHQQGLPNRLPHAPWPNNTDPGTDARPPTMNGALADAPAAAGRRPGQRTGGQGGQGPLVETIPRRMKVGTPSSAQVRISRSRIDGLIHLLMKGHGMTLRPETLITRTLSVRLRAPNGGFWIEAASPETQWLETAPGLHQDEHVTWRWTVTPQRRGRGRLILVVAARTVGHDGLAAETAPPDRAIEVTVTGGRLRRLARWSGLLAALFLGAVVSRFGGELWTLSAAIIKRMIG